MPSLREIRAERLLSIRELARLADVAPITVLRIEAGRATPRPGTARRLAAALDVAPGAVDEFRRAGAAARRPRPRPAGGDPRGAAG
jgi:transcriptional regulator with XRE-family HTH domain